MTRALRTAAREGVDAQAVAARARALGVMGWVRPSGELHAEGAPAAVQALVDALGDAIAVEPARVEGHEQFAIRGVSAGPSLDPATRRFAIEVGDHGMGHNDFEGPLGGGGVIVWDRGSYEQGGRVAWPEALERGHAVFVLHGEKLRGGFALQRTRAGDKAHWLLVKRRDGEARPGSDIAAERPESVLSGRTLPDLLA